MWLVYIVLCSDNTLYTGITNNLERRLKQHNNGTGAKYTKFRVPVSVIWSKEIGSKSDALKEEYRIKQLPREEKLKIVNGLLNNI